MTPTILLEHMVDNPAHCERANDYAGHITQLMKGEPLGVQLYALAAAGANICASPDITNDDEVLSYIQELAAVMVTLGASLLAMRKGLATPGVEFVAASDDRKRESH